MCAQVCARWSLRWSQGATKGARRKKTEGREGARKRQSPTPCPCGPLASPSGSPCVPLRCAMRVTCATASHALPLPINRLRVVCAHVCHACVPRDALRCAAGRGQARGTGVHAACCPGDPHGGTRAVGYSSTPLRIFASKTAPSQRPPQATLATPSGTHRDAPQDARSVCLVHG